MLTLRGLPARTAAHHWRANAAVLLGAAVGAAVLTGALLVGDSLRGSLRDRALRQLNGIEASWVGPRFVRQEIAASLPESVTPAVLLQGSVQSEPAAGRDRARLSGGTAVGLPPDSLVSDVVPDAAAWADGRPVAVLAARVADRLGVKAGDRITLGVERQSAVPRGSLLGRREADDVTAKLRIEVAAVLPPEHPANDFGLFPNPSAPLNVYVPLKYLQERVGQPGKANGLLARGAGADELNAAFAAKLTPADWGLRAHVPPRRKAYASVESEQLLLDPAAVAAVERATAGLKLRGERTTVYLANAITSGAGSIPYSVVAALDPAAGPPLGPFLPAGATALADDEIVLVEWDESPLKGAKPGDPVTLTYFKPEMEAGIEETSATFKLKGFVPLAGPALDPDLTPPFPGVTDKLTIGDWDPPFTFDSKRIGKRDEAYWEKHRATPKAYISRPAGERLFGSRFGTVTSVRVAPAAGQTPEQTATALTDALRRTLDPAAGGFVFEPTRERLLAASKGGTDFGGLFLGFSLFLIVSALLLVALLFRLNVERRAKEVGVLLACGYSPGQVRRLLLWEGVILSVAGAAVGLVLAVAYSRLLLSLLAALWPDDEVRAVLRPHVTPASLATGFAATVLMTAVAVWLGVRGLVRVPAPSLLRGETQTGETTAKPVRQTRGVVLAGVCLVAAVGLLVAGGGLSNPDFRAMSFFGGGALLLAAGLTLVRLWLRSSRGRLTVARGPTALAGLGRRNASRNPGRSLLTVILLSTAAFLLVVVESFRRQPDQDFLAKTGGSGGYNLVAEADVPLFRPIDPGDDESDLMQGLRTAFQDAVADDPGGPGLKERLDAARRSLAGVTVTPLRLRAGDDASCLNLYQAGRPRLLGVPDAVVQRGGFRFGQTEAETAEEKANPWLLLAEPRDDGAVPVFGEQNTVMWMLKKGVDDTVEMPDEAGNPVRLRIVGTLLDSVFQSELLMRDAAFRRLYPRQDGYRVFLVEAPPGREAAVADLLETGLRANGLSVAKSADRVAAFQAVIGTYLTMFQLLGGFGLLLGVLGLAVVILRGVWERVGELALLRAFGYSRGAVQAVVLSEHVLLLFVGVGLGVAAALVAVAPHVAAGGSVPWGRLAVMLGAVVLAGLAVVTLTTRGASAVPLVPALRNE